MDNTSNLLTYQPPQRSLRFRLINWAGSKFKLDSRFSLTISFGRSPMYNWIK